MSKRIIKIITFSYEKRRVNYLFKIKGLIIYLVTLIVAIEMLTQYNSIYIKSMLKVIIS